MIETIPPDENHDRNMQDLRSALGVDGWWGPVDRDDATPPPPREDGAPAWWVSDEEASQAFLRSMGVALDG